MIDRGARNGSSSVNVLSVNPTSDPAPKGVTLVDNGQDPPYDSKSRVMEYCFRFVIPLWVRKPRVQRSWQAGQWALLDENIQSFQRLRFFAMPLFACIVLY